METGWKKSAKADIVVNGVCEEYSELLSRAASKVEALALYKRGIDWCLENDSPSVDLLRRFKEDCAASGIFIDRHFDGELLNYHNVYVFHNCSGTIRTGLNLEKRLVPMLYFSNGCSMRIEGASLVHVVIPLYIFGTNDIICEGDSSIEPKFYRK